MPRFLHRAFIQWTDRPAPGEPRGLSPGVLLFGAFAKPLSWIYRAGAALDYRFRHKQDLRLSDRSQLVVVSSPAVGGVGKTPLVADLASRLATNGYDTHIVTLGYNRRLRGDITLDGSAPAISVERSGDEAHMLRQMTGLPVHVGDDPTAVIARLDSAGEGRCIVFDDGVSRRWSSEKRIVTLGSRDLERPVRFLPDGRWRISPKQAWPVTGVAVVYGGNDSPRCDLHTRVLGDWGYQGPIGWYRTTVDGITRLGDLDLGSLDDSPDTAPYVFCGLGTPSRFLHQVKDSGMTPKASECFPDHHSYTVTDIKRLLSRCRRVGARWLLTTHKDAVKIDPRWIKDLPVYFLRISLELTDGTDMLSVILESAK